MFRPAEPLWNRCASFTLTAVAASRSQLSRDQRTWRALVLGMLVVRLTIAIAVARNSASVSPDYDRFWTIASSPAAPYVAYRVEYTPFAVRLFQTLRRVAPNRVAFGRGMVSIAYTADVVAATALTTAFGWESAAIYLLTTFPLLNLFYDRFDLVPTAAAAVAIAALRRARPVLAASALVAACALKLWALPLSALLVVDSRPAVRRTQTLALVTGGVVVGAMWLALAGTQGTAQILTFRGASGWQIETVVGNLIALSSHATLRYELNAYRVGSISSPAIVAWLTLGLGVAFALAWIGMHAGRVGATWLCSIGALLALSPLLSPQFMAWIAPGAAIAWVERDRWPAALAAFAFLLTSLFVGHYDDLLRGSWWELVVLSRNLCLCIMIVVAAQPSVRLPRAGRRPGLETT